jgi:ATP-dependent RNA helicase DeaD
VSWEFAPTFDAAHRAALESGKPLIYVCPPAGWALVPLLDRLPAGGATVLVLVPTPTDAPALAASLDGVTGLQPLHGLSGLARTRRLLAAGAIRTLVCTPTDALALARQSALALGAVGHVVVAWPEQILQLEQGGALDAVLGETREAQRIVATADEHLPALADLLARLAHRAPVLVASRPPEIPLAAPVRYAVVPEDRRLAAVRVLLDTVNPDRVLLWEPGRARTADWAGLVGTPGVRVATDPGTDRVDAAIATDLPSAEALAALAAVARDVLVLVAPGQLPYLHRLVPHARAVRVTGESDVALDRALAVRRRLRERLAAGGLDAELLTIAPLLDEHDPALVAAAALALGGHGGAPAAPETSGWTRVWVGLGRKDGIRPGDVVGALLNEVGLPKGSVGRIDLRDAFAVVEVRADEAERAVRGLTGTVLRGRRATARLDRR